MKSFIALAMLALTGLATAAPLPMPAGYPTLLGASCGGVHVTVYITGFNADHTITGEVYAWTRCGGSGRGGGYKTTLYSSWHTLKWDFFGNYVVNDYDGGPAVNSVAVDEYGNVATAINGVADLTVKTVPPDAAHLLYAVPAVVGLQDADSKAAVEAVSLVYSPTYVYSSTVAAGAVILINPAAGQRVAPDSTVNATVSLWRIPKVAVPNVVGTKYLDAENLLDSLQLYYSETFSYSDTVPVDAVISHSPTARDSEGDPQRVPIQTTVYLDISLGPDPNAALPVAVPDVVGIDYITAIDTIQGLGLQVGPNSAFVYSDTVPAYNVVSTDPVAGTSLVTGAAVDIFVSAGPCDPATMTCP
jgi:beta-lactam-binding protein with PASTA domain